MYRFVFIYVPTGFCALRKNIQKNIFLNQIVFRHLSKYTIIEMNIVFKALNDATRRKILEMLQKQDLTAGEIAEQFQMSFPSISHHLDLLKQAQLVTTKKEGQFIYYSLNTTVMDEIVKWLLQFKTKKK